jgi:predicted AAA+ superfamily ATPase
MFIRSQIETLESRVKEERRFIQVIMGPRQVGKTTLINQLLKKNTFAYIFESSDGVSNSDSAWLQQVWETARVTLKTTNSTEFLLVIDEIQKIANWSEVVKQQWDRDTRENTNIKLILLGSSRLLIQRGLTESLAGRFETIHLGHWSFPEMEEAFGWNIEQYIYFGGYPGSATLIDDEDRWKNYIKDSLIETSISKDILMLTRVDKPALLKRLFEVGSLYSGQILSYTKLVGELQDAGNTTTLSHYLKMLSDCGLMGGIEKFAGNVIRQRSSSPKFQVYNNALLSAQGNSNFEEIFNDPKEWGRMVESGIGSNLINHSLTERYNIYYWRENSNEVDFVLEKNGKVVAIEVKSGKKSKNKGIDIFAKKYNPAKVLLVGTGGIPLETFLRINPGTLFH